MSSRDFTLNITDARFEDPTNVLAIEGTDESGDSVVVRIDSYSLGKIFEAAAHLSAERNPMLAAGGLAGVYVPRGITIEAIEGGVSMTSPLRSRCYVAPLPHEYL